MIKRFSVWFIILLILMTLVGCKEDTLNSIDPPNGISSQLWTTGLQIYNLTSSSLGEEREFNKEELQMIKHFTNLTDTSKQSEREFTELVMKLALAKQEYVLASVTDDKIEMEIAHNSYNSINKQLQQWCGINVKE